MLIYRQAQEKGVSSRHPVASRKTGGKHRGGGASPYRDRTEEETTKVHNELTRLALKVRVAQYIARWLQERPEMAMGESFGAGGPVGRGFGGGGLEKNS